VRIRSRVAALQRMSRRELEWRVRSGARTAVHHLRSSARQSRWRRADLLAALTDAPELEDVRRLLARHAWQDAHVALSRYFCEQPQRFVIGPGSREPLRDAITRRFPESTRHAVVRADRILAGEYDLLGYRGLRFASASAPFVDWHLDPVHGRRMPKRFWSTIAYLDPAFGDHKIVWELNRHQHWMTLLRAHWLSGEASYRERFVEELKSWMPANPPLTGANWSSMLELGFRSISWTWALNGFADSSSRDESPWTIDLLLGLDRQLDHVEQNLSYYFSPNTHLLGEALALYVTGRALPALAANARRGELGGRLLVAEAQRQIAPDGGHRERSAHYHRYTLDFYLLALVVARITSDPIEPDLSAVVRRLADAAAVLADDRGRFPHFGDDDGGSTLPICGRATDDVRDSLAIADVLLGHQSIADAPEEACWVLAHPSLASVSPGAPAAAPARERTSASLPDMGYFVSRSRGGVHALVHAGPRGYLNGGHAHADALSMTVALRGTPLLIDPGTGCYTTDADARDRFRSTAYHNTAQLNGRSQSMPDGPFHWTSAPTTVLHAWRTSPDFDYFEASHDGYHPFEHRRHVLFLHDDLIVVFDRIDGPAIADAATHWHIDPRWKVAVDGPCARVSVAGEAVDFWFAGGEVEHLVADPSTGLGFCSREYGKIEPGSTLRARASGEIPMWMAMVINLDARNAVSAVERVLSPNPSAASAAPFELEIARRHSIDRVVVGQLQGQNPAAVQSNGIETDARFCFWRSEGPHVSAVGLVDGSFMRGTGGHRFGVALRTACAQFFGRPGTDSGSLEKVS
jgi:hypothetical protein